MAVYDSLTTSARRSRILRRAEDGGIAATLAREAEQVNTLVHKREILDHKEEAFQNQLAARIRAAEQKIDPEADEEQRAQQLAAITARLTTEQQQTGEHRKYAAERAAFVKAVETATGKHATTNAHLDIALAEKMQTVYQAGANYCAKVNHWVQKAKASGFDKNFVANHLLPLDLVNNMRSLADLASSKVPRTAWEHVCKSSDALGIASDLNDAAFIVHALAEGMEYDEAVVAIKGYGAGAIRDHFEIGSSTPTTPTTADTEAPELGGPDLAVDAPELPDIDVPEVEIPEITALDVVQNAAGAAADVVGAAIGLLELVKAGVKLNDSHAASREAQGEEANLRQSATSLRNATDERLGMLKITKSQADGVERFRFGKPDRAYQDVSTREALREKLSVDNAMGGTYEARVGTVNGRFADFGITELANLKGLLNSGDNVEQARLDAMIKIKIQKAVMQVPEKQRLALYQALRDEAEMVTHVSTLGRMSRKKGEQVVKDAGMLAVSTAAFATKIAVGCMTAGGGALALSAIGATIGAAKTAFTTREMLKAMEDSGIKIPPEAKKAIEKSLEGQALDETDSAALAKFDEALKNEFEDFMSRDPNIECMLEIARIAESNPPVTSDTVKPDLDRALVGEFVNHFTLTKTERGNWAGRKIAAIAMKGSYTEDLAYLQSEIKKLDDEVRELERYREGMGQVFGGRGLAKAERAELRRQIEEKQEQRQEMTLRCEELNKGLIDALGANEEAREDQSRYLLRSCLLSLGAVEAFKERIVYDELDSQSQEMLTNELSNILMMYIKASEEESKVTGKPPAITVTTLRETMAKHGAAHFNSDKTGFFSSDGNAAKRADLSEMLFNNAIGQAEARLAKGDKPELMHVARERYGASVAARRNYASRAHFAITNLNRTIREARTGLSVDAQIHIEELDKLKDNLRRNLTGEDVAGAMKRIDLEIALITKMQKLPEGKIQDAQAYTLAYQHAYKRSPPRSDFSPGAKWDRAQFFERFKEIVTNIYTHQAENEFGHVDQFTYNQQRAEQDRIELEREQRLEDDSVAALQASTYRKIGDDDFIEDPEGNFYKDDHGEMMAFDREQEMPMVRNDALQEGFYNRRTAVVSPEVADAMAQLKVEVVLQAGLHDLLPEISAGIRSETREQDEAIRQKLRDATTNFALSARSTEHGYKASEKYVTDLVKNVFREVQPGTQPKHVDQRRFVKGVNDRLKAFDNPTPAQVERAVASQLHDLLAERVTRGIVMATGNGLGEMQPKLDRAIENFSAGTLAERAANPTHQRLSVAEHTQMLVTRVDGVANLSAQQAKPRNPGMGGAKA